MLPFEGAHLGRERCGEGSFARHRHAFGYICVVLSGGFKEAGESGRFCVSAGDAILHQPFEAHLDVFARSGADILNLPLPEDVAAEGRVRIADPDSIARLAEQDVGAAARAAAASLPCDAADEDWPDMLASALRSCRPFSLGTWASQHRLAAATVTRGFRKAYGITPARYRAEIRARRAWQAVHASADPLAAIAGDGGFADQAHMTRAVRQVTGQPPGRWRTA